jgi:osmotically-inducible protein OsmY
MKNTITLISLILLLTLEGCSNVITATTADPIKERNDSRSMGAYIDDESLETKALVNIKKSDQGFTSSHIIVVSYNGTVLLAGQVTDEKLRAKAADVVKKLQKVKRIYNELAVSGNTSAIVRSGDAWVTAKVKTALITSPEIESLRVKVITENSIVYLMGLATKAEAERIVDVSSSIYGVQKVIRLFEYID